MENTTAPLRKVGGNDIFSSHPSLQISISTFNLVNIALVIFISSKIDRKDISRLYTLWLYYAQAPSDVCQIGISILQLLGLVDSSGKYYRDTYARNRFFENFYEVFKS
ncbi:hypothetical protein L596_013443 [Steinernema carpocapsae]|uniref:Uncharacterized protein n=1 Tax=Steinernema carpocapsae TaxID=34508 RepID=A0A4U5P054_STECR|nr:hypothetical protein L596_013443 [Steinernema carpocapsae]